MASGSAQFDEILQTPEAEEPPPIELTGPQYVRTLAGASAPFPYFDPLEISSKVCVVSLPSRFCVVKKPTLAVLILFKFSTHGEVSPLLLCCCSVFPACMKRGASLHTNCVTGRVETFATKSYRTPTEVRLHQLERGGSRSPSNRALHTYVHRLSRRSLALATYFSSHFCPAPNDATSSARST